MGKPLLDTLITPLTEPHHAAYDAYLKNHPDTLLYHHRAWWEVLRRSYGYTPASLIALDETQTLRGALPLMKLQGRIKGRRLVGLPFSHIVPPLADSPDILQRLLDAAITQAADVRYLEIRARQPLPDVRFRPSTQNYISELDLTPPIATIFKNISESSRRHIRRAEDAGLAVWRGTSPADYQRFYELEVDTRHRQGAPVYPARFFADLQALLGEYVRLYLVSVAGQAVAGLVVFHAGKRAIYAYGASLRLPELKNLPTHALMWHAIQEAHHAGLACFDFGTTPIHHDGLLEFKSRFKPHTSELATWIYRADGGELPVIKRDSRSVQWVEKALQRMPRFLFRWVGPLLLREVG